MPRIFEKYESLINKPNGRPAGVRNGQGEQALKPSSPALDGMKHAVTGVRDQLVSVLMSGPANTGTKPRPHSPQTFASPKTLAEKQHNIMRKMDTELKDQSSVEKEIETLNSWIEALK